MTQRSFFVALISISILLGCKVKKDSPSVEIISSAELQTLSQLEAIQLVDVRTPQEYEEGHIIDFINIDFLSEDFQTRIKRLDKTKPVIVYCRSGGRSSRCASQLIEKGFVKVYDLEGGISKWIMDGLPVEN